MNELAPMMARADSPAFGLNDSIYNRLLRERIIWLGSEVRDENANAICAQMMLLAAEEPGQGHLAVHQLARWLDHRGHGDLRHHAVHPAGRPPRSRWAWRLDGPVPAVVGAQGSATPCPTPA